MKSSIRLGRIFGIPIELHVSFLLILPVFIWIFAVNPPPWGFSNFPEPLNYVLSTGATILLFTSVILHEIAHSLVALRKGVRIKSITLMLFGGIALMEDIPEDPRTEALISSSGPIASFSLALIFYFLHIIPSPLTPLFLLLSYLNLALGLFNLIPAFPMDGGRILRAFLARRMPFVEATRRAAEIGKLIAIIMAFFGLFYSLWLLIIAFFVYIGASEEEKATELSSVFEGLRVRDIMTENVSCVSPDLSVEELLHRMFEEKHMGYPVLEEGELAGIVTFEDVKKVPSERRKETRVSEIMSRDVMIASPDDPLSTVVKRMSEMGVGRVPVVEAGKLVGIVSRTDILKSLQILLEMQRE